MQSSLFPSINVPVKWFGCFWLYVMIMTEYDTQRNGCKTNTFIHKINRDKSFNGANIIEIMSLFCNNYHVFGHIWPDFNLQWQMYARMFHFSKENPQMWWSPAGFISFRSLSWTTSRTLPGCRGIRGSTLWWSSSVTTHPRHFPVIQVHLFSPYLKFCKAKVWEKFRAIT